MKDENFDYLKPYLSPPKNIEKKPRNWFYPVSNKEIIEAEKNLGYNFPSQLRNFYRKIGYGSLAAPHNAHEDYKILSDNYIHPPSMLVEIILLGHDSGHISEEVLESMKPGDLPFFHIGDSSSFLFMKPKSSKPNAVYNEWGELVEESFDRFIWRLYYESPDYYGELA